MSFHIDKLDVKDEDQIKQPDNCEIIGEHCMRSLFVGATKSGKTNMMLQMLTNKKFFRKSKKKT